MTTRAHAWAETLQVSGYRLTRQRRKILDLLEERGMDHPSVRQIFNDLTAMDGKVGIATVYNTLGSLVRLGLIKVIEFENADNRFEVNLLPHVNLICRNCGKIEDSTVETPPPEFPPGTEGSFRVLDTRMEYYGLCGGCVEVASPKTSESALEANPVAAC